MKLIELIEKPVPYRFWTNPKTKNDHYEVLEVRFKDGWYALLINNINTGYDPFWHATARPQDLEKEVNWGFDEEFNFRNNEIYEMEWE